MRRGKLVVLGTGVVLAVAAVIALAASAAARHAAPDPRVTAAGTTARGVSGAAGGAGTAAGRMAAVSPAIGLRPGALSPSAAGLAAAQAVLPKLTVAQLAGQRVIYSYTGLNPPAGLLKLIRH
ncbi:MAG TPA: hypothetical protein VEM58_11505, partial [Streptosporangiaceae bacterium]|nr:hypothetical protein [Streptosporangiaceae bacterium]